MYFRDLNMINMWYRMWHRHAYFPDISGTKTVDGICCQICQSDNKSANRKNLKMSSFTDLDYMRYNEPVFTTLGVLFKKKLFNRKSL